MKTIVLWLSIGACTRVCLMKNAENGQKCKINVQKDKRGQNL